MPEASRSTPPVMPLPPARYNVLGVGVSALIFRQAVDLLVDARDRKRLGYVCVTGAHGIMEARSDAGLRRIHNEAYLVTPDGMPLVWLGPEGVERVYGPDLMLAVCAAGQPTGLKHFFLGGGHGVAEALVARLRTRFPELAVVGTFTPPFRALNADEETALSAAVARAQPDIIWVGLGTPKQERFMATHWRELEAGLLVGVGAAFDFHSGRVRQAPRWMQRSGFEWLFRLCTEPRRLGPRYLRHNPGFLLRILLQRTRLRHYPLE